MPNKETKNQVTHDESPAYGPGKINQQQVSKIEVKDPEYLEYFKGH